MIHIPGKRNVIADAYSRGAIDEAFAAAAKVRVGSSDLLAQLQGALPLEPAGEARQRDEAGSDPSPQLTTEDDEEVAREHETVDEAARREVDEALDAAAQVQA